MPLSEHEERILAEIERQLAADDPRFVARARRTPPPRGRRRLVLAMAAFVLGFLCLLGIVVHITFGFVGFGLMFAGVLIGVPEVQRRREGRVDAQSRK